MSPKSIGKPQRFREMRLLLVIIAFAFTMSVYSAWTSETNFLSGPTIRTMMLYLFGYAIMACGMTILLVSGGFDLSVGSVAALSAMVAAVLMKDQRIQIAWPLAVLAGLGTGIVAGLFNGIVVAGIGINPFITTLGTMLLARGLTHIASNGRTQSGFPDPYLSFGQGYFQGIQMPIVISVVLVIVFDILLRRSRFFRQNYYIGGNEQAAWLSGISVNRIKVFNYCLSGLLAAVAGLLMAARLNSTAPNAAEGFELTVITAVVLGGASLSGGAGTVLGAFLGCVLLAMIRPAISFLGIQDEWEKVIIGGILLMAVILDQFGRRRK